MATTPASGTAVRRESDRRWRLVLGLGAAGLLVLFLGGGFLILPLATGEAPDLVSLAFDSYIRSVVAFTLEQAFLSTVLSLIGAAPLALALHRSKFPGRSVVLRLFLLPQALPVLVGALAILTIWGRQGIVSDASSLLGLPRLDIYGLSGILIAHVFFNMPLAARLMLSSLDRVPAESWKLAGQLSLTPVATFRLIELPAIRAAIPGAASLIFMLCATSFTLVLVLGGGPSATTLEVAIYQSLRYDFDPGQAVALSLLQIGLTAAILSVVTSFGGTIVAGFGLGARAVRFDARSASQRILDSAILAIGIVFVASPFVAVLARGLVADLPRLLADPAVHRATLTSLTVAFAAATLALIVSTLIVLAIEALRSAKTEKRDARRRALEITASLVLVVPPIVVGAGWFLALRQIANVFSAAPYVVVATNAAMAVPFVVRIVGPALAAQNASVGKLADSLGLAGPTRLRFVDFPAIRAPLGLAFAFSLAISLGDLGAIALFGNRDFVTLPYLLLERMGSYRTADAAGLALILGVLCLALMTLAERGLSMHPGTATK